MDQSDEDEDEEADEFSSMGKSDDDDDDDDEDKYMLVLGKRIDGFRFVDRETYRLMENRLPSGIGGFKIITDVMDGYLYIRTVPGRVHERASRAYEAPIVMWAQNNTPMIGNPPLIPDGSAGMWSSLLSANCVNRLLVRQFA